MRWKAQPTRCKPRSARPAMRQRIAALGLSLVACAMGCSAAEAQHEARAPECVVLLHGLWRTGLSMKPLEWRLEKAGYHVINITYASLFYPIEELAERALSRGINRCREANATAISIVTHSLGGILARHYLREHRVELLKRVVMLGPPNQGSQIADYLTGVEWLDVVIPEAAEQLTTDDDSLPRQLGPVDFELGIIAGTSGRGAFIFAEPGLISDGTVSVAETRVTGMTDFLALPTSHTFMIWNREVMRQTLYFLAHGRFDIPATPGTAGTAGTAGESGGTAAESGLQERQHH